MNRRNFLKKAALGAAGLAVTTKMAEAERRRKKK